MIGVLSSQKTWRHRTVLGSGSWESTPDEVVERNIPRTFQTIDGCSGVDDTVVFAVLARRLVVAWLGDYLVLIHENMLVGGVELGEDFSLPILPWALDVVLAALVLALVALVLSCRSWTRAVSNSRG
ncbi:unnamed protein product [Prunus brigantina]